MVVLVSVRLVAAAVDAVVTLSVVEEGEVEEITLGVIIFAVVGVRGVVANFVVGVVDGGAEIGLHMEHIVIKNYSISSFIERFQSFLVV